MSGKKGKKSSRKKNRGLMRRMFVDTGVYRKYLTFSIILVITGRLCLAVAPRVAGRITDILQKEVLSQNYSVGNFLPLAIALALTRNMKGANVHRTVFFMPNLIGGIVLGYIWLILINCALSLMGKNLIALNATYGFWGLIILMCWQQIGYMMIIYIAGLQSIPSDYLEAAKIDGANAWQTLWKVKIPNLMSSITICLFLSITNGFKLFDQNLALTGGDPGHASEMLALNIYNTFYARSGPQWKGYGQAKAALFCILVIVISMIQLKSTRSKEVQQ